MVVNHNYITSEIEACRPKGDGSVSESVRGEFDQRVSNARRADVGRNTCYFGGQPKLTLTTTGARTGLLRRIDLAYLPERGGPVVVAANGGRPRHPAWYHNLVADPHATVDLHGGHAEPIEPIEVIAEVVTGSVRDALYERFVAQFPLLALYQAGTTRRFPIIVLRPTDT